MDQNESPNDKLPWFEVLKKRINFVKSIHGNYFKDIIIAYLVCLLSRNPVLTFVTARISLLKIISRIFGFHFSFVCQQFWIFSRNLSRI